MQIYCQLKLRAAYDVLFVEPFLAVVQSLDVYSTSVNQIENPLGRLTLEICSSPSIVLVVAP